MLGNISSDLALLQDFSTFEKNPSTASASVTEVVAQVRALLAQEETSQQLAKAGNEGAGYLQWIRSVLSETNPDTFSRDLYRLAESQLHNVHLGALAQALLKILSQSELPSASRAAHHLNVLAGRGGTVGEYAAQALRQVSQGEHYGPLAMALASTSLVGRGAGLLARRVLGSRGVVGLGLEFAGGAAKLGVESLAFPVASALGRGVFGQSTKIEDYWGEARHGAEIMGGLGLAARVGRLGYLRFHRVKASGVVTRFRALSLFTKPVSHLVPELGVLTAINQRDRGGDLIFNAIGGLATMVQLRGAQGLNVVAFPGLPRLMQRLDFANYQAVKNAGAKGWQGVARHLKGGGRALGMGRRLAYEGPNTGAPSRHTPETSLHKLLHDPMLMAKKDKDKSLVRHTRGPVELGLLTRVTRALAERKIRRQIMQRHRQMSTILGQYFSDGSYINGAATLGFKFIREGLLLVALGPDGHLIQRLAHRSFGNPSNDSFNPDRLIWLREFIIEDNSRRGYVHPEAGVLQALAETVALSGMPAHQVITPPRLLLTDATAALESGLYFASSTDHEGINFYLNTKEITSLNRSHFRNSNYQDKSYLLLGPRVKGSPDHVPPSQVVVSGVPQALARSFGVVTRRPGSDSLQLGLRFRHPVDLEIRFGEAMGGFRVAAALPSVTQYLPAQEALILEGSPNNWLVLGSSGDNQVTSIRVNPLNDLNGTMRLTPNAPERPAADGDPALQPYTIFLDRQ